MKNITNKKSGSYYTPYRTVYFMKEYLENEHRTFESILEPSAGDGRFVDVFDSGKTIQRFTVVELMEEKVKALKQKNYPSNVQIIKADFLDFSEQVQDKFQLIVGNPPYISLKNMEADTIKKVKRIGEKYQLSGSLMKNAWVAFVLASVSCLETDGAVFLVLPMEFLQVQYAEKIRIFLEERFNTIHILAFKERMFPEIEQEACLVYMTNANIAQPCIEFKIYEVLDSGTPCYYSKIQKNKPLKKWTNAILTDMDIDLLNVFDSKYKKISDLCYAAPGIVTGANNEFILTSKQVEQLKCQQFVLPTIPKSSMLSGTFILTEDIVRALGEQGNRIYLLNLSKVGEEWFSRELKIYLEEIGNQENAAGIKLKNRYKCKNRKPWYGVPIVQNGTLFFFKRYDKIPRICVNEAHIHTTDIAYNMRLHPGYDEKSLAFCFYNTLTLTQCEYYGRYYAGGVLELTPSEFKSLAIPYRTIQKEDIDRLSGMFKEHESIEKIINFVDSKTIEEDWEDKKITKLNDMRKKLTARRFQQ